MNLLFGALSMGLVLSLLGLGVYISYRVLDTFDLTVDGSFAFGAVIAGVLLTRGLGSFWASAADSWRGWRPAPLTGVIHRRLGVSRLLSGLLVATALYSLDLMIMGGGDISLASTPTLPTQAFALWQWFGGPESGATIFGVEVSARTLATFLALLPAVGTAVFLVERFFRTSAGPGDARHGRQRADGALDGHRRRDGVHRGARDLERAGGTEWRAVRAVPGLRQHPDERGQPGDRPRRRRDRRGPEPGPVAGQAHRRRGAADRSCCGWWWRSRSRRAFRPTRSSW